jgi:hypothetical protein
MVPRTESEYVARSHPANNVSIGFIYFPGNNLPLGISQGERIGFYVTTQEQKS